MRGAILILMLLLVIPISYAGGLEITDIKAMEDLALGKTNYVFVFFENNLDKELKVKFIGNLVYNNEIIKKIERDNIIAEPNSKVLIKLKLDNLNKDGNYLIRGYLESKDIVSNVIDKEIKVLKPSNYFIKVQLSSNPFIVILTLFVLAFISISIRRRMDERG